MNKYAAVATLLIVLSVGSCFFVDMSGHNGAYHILLLLLTAGPALLVVFIMAYRSDQKKKDKRNG